MVDFSQLEGIQGVRGNKSSSISLWLIFLKLSQVESIQGVKINKSCSILMLHYSGDNASDDEKLDF